MCRISSARSDEDWFKIDFQDSPPNRHTHVRVALTVYNLLYALTDKRINKLQEGQHDETVSAVGGLHQRLVRERAAYVSAPQHQHQRVVRDDRDQRQQDQSHPDAGQIERVRNACEFIN